MNGMEASVEREHPSEPSFSVELVRKLEMLTGEEVARSTLRPRLQKSLRVLDWSYFVVQRDGDESAPGGDAHRVVIVAHPLRTYSKTRSHHADQAN